MFEQSARSQRDVTSPSLVQEKSWSSNGGELRNGFLVTCLWMEHGKGVPDRVKLEGRSLFGLSSF